LEVRFFIILNTKKRKGNAKISVQLESFMRFKNKKPKIKKIETNNDELIESKMVLKSAKSDREIPVPS